MSKSFESLWDIQKNFSNEISLFFFNKTNIDLSYDDQIKQSKDYILSLIGECKEALDTFDWKIHRTISMEFNRNDLLEELIDIQKYLWGLMAVWNISKDEFIQTFINKSKIVENRWDAEIARN